MKKYIYILMLVLSIIIMLSGLTMSYFHDKANNIHVPFTIGTVDMEIKEILPDGLDSWKPGKDNALTLNWTFENVGSMPAKLSVQVKGEWDGNENLENDAVKFDINDGNWSLNEDVHYQYYEPVREDESAGLSLNVWFEIDKDDVDIEKCAAYNNAEYNINLTLYAEQVTGSWE